jgi:hypothetical protein
MIDFSQHSCYYVERTIVNGDFWFEMRQQASFPTQVDPPDSLIKGYFRAFLGNAIQIPDGYAIFLGT